MENWMLMGGNLVMLWFIFSSGKVDCFCNHAAWLTEAQEKPQREDRIVREKNKNWENIPNPSDNLVLEEAQECL